MPQPPSRPGDPRRQASPPAPPASVPPPAPPAAAAPPPMGAPPAPPVSSAPAASPPQPPAATAEPPAASPPEPPAETVAPETFNDTQDVATRPCWSCGGQLEFHIESQQLQCPQCGYSEAIVHDPNAAVVEQVYNPHALQAFAGSEMTHAEGEKEIVCQNCGGHTTFVGTMTSTRCPYCATPIQRTDVHEAPDRLRVDAVLPFAITDDQASAALENWISKRWFAPTEFKKYSTAGSFESVYASYFTYDASAMTDYRGERGETRTRTVGHGENRRTETYTEWYHASGRVWNEFDDVTILANTGFTEKYVNKLDPWPAHQIQPYHSDYIAGHLCRTYDRDIQQCFVDARRIMDQTIDQSIRHDIGGSDQRIHDRQTQLSNVTYKHVLLPIWLLTVIYEGQPWQVFINGATGEIHGERPWSKVKIAATIALVVTIIVVLLVLRSLAG